MKINYVAFGILIGTVGGYFFFLYGPDLVISAIKDHAYFIVFVVLAIFISISILFVFSENIIKWITGSSMTSVTNLAEKLANNLRDIPGFEKYAPSSGRIIRELAGLYASWSLRIMIFRAIVGCAVALGGLFATFVLVKQLDVISQ